MEEQQSGSALRALSPRDGAEGQAAPSGKSAEDKNSKPLAEQASSRKLEALQLARSRIQQQLEAATNERYAEQLRQALAAIEKQLAQG